MEKKIFEKLIESAIALGAYKASVVKAGDIETDRSFRRVFSDMNITKVLHLGAGGCGVCKRCAKVDGEPCRFPSEAMPSLEAYGINVSSLASLSGMKYINGQNTVTYFGAVLFSLGEE